MGDVRFLTHYEQLRSAPDPLAAMRALDDEAIISALAGASVAKDAYLANVLATEALNRTRRATVVTQTLGDAVVAVDDRGRITVANPAAAAILGWPRQELVGSRLEDGILPPLDALPDGCAGCVGLLDTLRDGRTRTGDDGALRARSGRVVPVAYTASAIVVDGAPAGAVVVFRDVTDARRRQAEARARRARRARQEAALLDLARDSDLHRGNLSAVHRKVTEVAARALGVERVSVWVYDEAGPTLRCVDRYEAGPETHLGGTLLSAADFPRYFDALASGRALAASDARADPRTSEFTAAYLEPHGIGAMLDAPVRSRGRLVGIVCHEHVGPPREWTPDEEAFAASVADTVALAIEAAERHRATDALRRRKAELGAILDALPDLIFRLDGDGRFLSMEAGRAIPYLPPEDFLGRRMDEVLPPPVADVVTGAFRRAMDTGVVTTAEYELPPGSDLHFEARIVPAEGGEAIVFVRDVTSDLYARRSVEAGDARLRLLLERLPAFAFATDAKLRFTFGHGVGLRALGLADDNLAGASAYDYLGTRDPDDPRVAALHAALEGRTTTYETEWQGRKLLVRAEPLRGSDGGVTGVFGLAADITERKRVEDASRRNEERLETLLRALGDSLNEGFIIRDAASRTTYANPAALRMLGVTLDELRRAPPGTLLSDLTDADGRPMDPADLPGMRAMQTGRSAAPLRFWATMPDGRRLCIEGTAVPLADAEGLPAGAVITFGDVTSEQRAKADLQQARTWRERLLDAAGEGILGIDPEGCTKFVNPAAARLFGRPTDDLLGRSLHDLVHHSRADGTPYPDPECPIRLALADGASRAVADEVFWRPDGTPFPVEYVVTPVRDEAGVTGAVVVFTDVTERKRAEAKVRTLNDALQARVRDLGETNAELEAFAFTVSHDLRTPLRGIDFLARALEEDQGDQLPAEAREHLRLVRRETRRMSHLVDDLLRFSRAGRLPLERRRVDLSALARQVLVALSDSEPDRHVHTRVEDGLVAHGDPRLLRVVLENLLGNAWKYTRRTPDARIDFTSDHADGAAATYHVRDNGAGFDPAEASRLFRPFQRLHTSAEFEGTGVGLATVRRIVERHGGHAWAEGAPGLGATFHFTLANGARDPDADAA